MVTKGQIYQKDRTILNVPAPSNVTSKYLQMTQTLTDRKTENFVTTTTIYNTPFSEIKRTSRQNLSKFVGNLTPTNNVTVMYQMLGSPVPIPLLKP